MFAVEVKRSALRANPSVRALVEEQGECIECPSRARAEALATELSEQGERVRIQRRAPQDPSDVDGYLIRFPRRSKDTPKHTGRAGRTFDITANQYGEIGRALLVGSYGVSRGFRHELLVELEGLEPTTHGVRACTEPSLPPDVGRHVSWQPDARVDIYRTGNEEPVRTYYLEVKTGSASFQRGQRTDMQRVAQEHRVLAVRVLIDRLPDEYTIRLDRITQ